MKRLKSVRTAGIACGGKDDVLATGGIGSCVVICMWHEQSQMGALAHVLLPHSKDYGKAAEPNGGPVPQGISADLAVPQLLRLLRRKCPDGEIVAKLVGGGNMFGTGTGAGLLSETPGKIVRSVKDHLAQNRINVIGECLGGEVGRSVEFDPESGSVLVEYVVGASKII